MAELTYREALAWLNGFPQKPVDTINYGYLDDTSFAMALFPLEGPRAAGRDVLGGTRYELRFRVVYRTLPDPRCNDHRLRASELLEALGDWAASNPPKPGIRAEVEDRARLLDRYENGGEDYALILKITYERI